ncbi:MAG: hypothetical protein CL878_07595 [Dehalococcoidia bacterium]|nr:hypothetical protein [Dehalococcoidia bacterium]
MGSPAESRSSEVGITKELFWEAPYTGCRLDAVVFGYASTKGPRLLGMAREMELDEDETGGRFRRERLIYSDDHGRTWQDGESFNLAGDGSHVLVSDYLDAETDTYFLFALRRVMDRAKLAGRHVMTYSRQLYRVSHDGGHSWGPEQPLIQTGAEFNEQHAARGIWYGKNGGYVCTSPIRLSSGTLLLPFQAWPWDAERQRLNTTKCSVVWIATSTPDMNRIEWEYGDYICGDAERYGSLCEMTITELTNGDVLAIMRASPPGTLSKFYCVSSDGGRSWSEPKALTFDSGEPLLSPSAISRFIRSSRNGKLYWIGNMYPFREDHYLTMPPNQQRFSLQIAEVDEETYGIRHDTVTTIDESEDGDVPREYSNFFVYEDRDSGNFILTMCEACALPLKHYEVPDSYTGTYMTRDNFTSHSYRYEIAL